MHVPEVSPTPFTEPVASLEMYRYSIYGSVSTPNLVQTETQGPEEGNGDGEYVTKKI